LPHPYQEIPYGERELDYPLPVDYVDPVIQFEPKLSKQFASAKARIHSNPEFKRINAYSTWLKSQEDETLIPLNYTVYFDREAELDREVEAYDDLLVSKDSLAVTFVTPNFQSTLDTSKSEEYTRWFEALSKDIYLGEAYRIVGDIGKN